MAERWNGRYEPLEVLGEGSQGKVLRALDHQHNRPVALKVRPAGSKAAREALLSEARILLSLRPHPNLPLVREDFFIGRRYVIVMDWVDGVDLGSVLASRGDPGLAPSAVLQWIAQVAQALDHLHAHEPPIVHGDVKPANCVLSAHGRVVLVDFGIAAVVGRGGGRRAGTGGYRAPEVSTGGELTPAADVFGLAATATTLLTGQPPGARRPDWEGIPPHVAATLERALRGGLAADPARRPPSASALVDRMRYWLGTGLPEGLVTVLATGIGADSPVWSANAELTASVLTRHDQLVASAVEGAGGRLVRSSAEGETQSVFTSVARAVEAAVGLQQELLDEEWPPTAGPLVRAGIHVGGAQVRNGEYVGPTALQAGRLRALAGPGQVLVSAPVAKALREAPLDGISLVDLGIDRRPGPERPERVFGLKHAALPDTLSPLRSPPGPARRWWWVAAAAFAAVLVTAAGLAMASRDGAPPTPGPDFKGGPTATVPSRPIYFESTRDGSRQIWVMNSNGRNARRVFGGPSSDTSENYLPKPSPEGKSVAFVSERDGGLEIYVMNADGTNQRRLTHNPGLDTTPSWSRDATKLAFTSDRGEGNEIYVMDAATGDTGPVQQITSVDGLAGYPVWSPDGSRIVFNSDHASGKNDLFVADATATMQAGTRLTHGRGHETTPAWSPDGHWIAFSGGVLAGDPDEIGAGDIYIVDATTGDRDGIRQVTDLGEYSWSPQWSPDGRLLVFLSNVDERTDNDIYVVPADAEKTRDIVRLTSTTTADDQNPNW